jgi:predicted DNA-binding transcriptional regulator YafY
MCHEFLPCPGRNWPTIGYVRASRLINLLLLLQTRGRMTAAELAAQLEVSERTIHRDVESLSAAGIPVYAERGPHGGISLIEGYRTRLTGMTAEEAEALFLSGVPGPAAELGLGTVMAAARLKVLAALPPELRSRASRLVERFHLDVSGWYESGEEAPLLGVLSQAVWDSRQVDVVYDRGDRLVERRLLPLGLVLKAGTWYLIASVEGQTRTYRMARFRGAEPTDRRFERPAGFDLAAFWAETTAAYERETERIEVTLRIHPRQIGVLADLAGASAVRAAETIRLPDADPAGWPTLRLRMEWPSEAPARLLALGEMAEVLEPPELRQRIAELAGQAVRQYASAAAAPANVLEPSD